MILCRYFLFLALLLLALPSWAQSFADDIVITEINYNAVQGADSLEYIELYNRRGNIASLAGYKLAYSAYNSAIDTNLIFIFPNISFPSGSRLLLARDTAAIRRNYLINNTIPYFDSLGIMNDNQGKIWLLNPDFSVIDAVEYRDVPPFPTAAEGTDGEGAAIALCDENNDGNIGSNWSAAMTISYGVIGGKTLRGSLLQDCGAKILSATVISPFVIEIQFDRGILVSSATDPIHYKNLNIGINLINFEAIDKVRILLNSALPNCFADTLFIDSVQTASGNPVYFDPASFLILHNNLTQSPQITEIFYNQPGLDTLEFIELYNHTPNSICLGGMRLTGDISFALPPYTVPPGKYIILAADTNKVKSFFNLNTIKMLQWHSGSLGDSVGVIKIQNSSGLTLDSVRYTSSNPWVIYSKGFGTSLRLCDSTLDNNSACNWTADTVNSFVRTLASGSRIYATPGRSRICNKPILSLGTSPQTGEDSVILRYSISPANHNFISKQWSTGATSDTLRVITSGNYSLTIYDSLFGCTQSNTVFAYVTNSLTTVVKAKFVDTPSSVPQNYQFGFKIHALNINNQLVTGFSDTVEISIVSGPALGQILGTDTVLAVGGIANFTNVFLSHTGTYRIKACFKTILTTVCDTVTITVFAPSPLPVRLKFNQVPPTGAQNQNVNRFYVKLLTNTNEVCSTCNGNPVVLSKYNGLGQMVGNTAGIAYQGLVTFDAVQFTDTGWYCFRAVSANLIPDSTCNLYISAGATGLYFDYYPAQVELFRQFTCRVQARNLLGQIDTTFNGTICITILSGPPNGQLTGTICRNAVRGLATFNDLTLTETGCYTLQASSGILTPSNSGLVCAIITTNELAPFDNKLINIYPNPVHSNKLYISGIENKECVIFDKLGRQILKSQLQTDNSIDVSSLTSGIYLLKIDNKSTKIVVFH